MEGRQDIFDRIMRWKPLAFLRPFYLKYKEILLYLFFGGLTTVISIGSFAIFCNWFSFDVLFANILSWVLSVAFAFATNKTWVFQSAGSSPNDSSIKQLFRFFTGRLLTLGVEECILFVFISLAGFSAVIVKVFAQFIVLVLNYLISKIVVFSAKNRT